MIKFLLVSLLISCVWAGEGEGEGNKDYPASGTFTVYEHDNNDNFDGTGFGQIETFSNKLYDKHNQNIIGGDQGTCVNTDVAGDTWFCNYSFYFPGGQIAVQGGPIVPVTVNTQSITYAIVGGTGIYEQAQGYVVATEPSDNVYEYVFHTKS